MTSNYPSSAPMPLTRDSIQIARLEEQFVAMRATMQEMAEVMDEMRKELGTVQKQLQEARGGWKTLVWLGGAAASLGGLVSWAAAHVRLQ